MSAAMALVKPSTSVVDDWINNWRAARLSKDTALGWPPDSILGRVQDMGPYAVSAGKRYGGRILSLLGLSTRERDAETVQRIVDQMPDEMRTAFEAYHLAIIRGDRCSDWPHKARALTLGITRDQYNYRVKAGWQFVADRVPA